MLKKILLTTAFLVVVIGSIAGVKILQITTLIAQTKGMTQPPEPVSTAVVTPESWLPTLSATGSLSAVQGVTVSAEMDGKVAAIHFEAGSAVKAGDVLVEQDTSAERAQLRAAEAAADLARINLERSRALIAKQTVAQSQVDSDEAAWKQAVAAADNIRALIAKKTVVAPFSGQLGVRQVNLGQILKAGDPIVSLQTLDPVYADFFFPQRDLAQLADGQKVILTGDGFGGRAVEGRITTINPEVDASTRTIRIQATVANTGGVLRPGMYANVSVELSKPDTVLAVPATSIIYAPYGNTIFVVEQEKNPDDGSTRTVAHQRVVRLGVARGDFVAVSSGLKAGETVVTSGGFRLREGSAVRVDNTLAPDAKIAPKPSDS